MEVIEQRKLKNGMELTVFDHSKRVAGDRWYLKISCEAEVLVPEDFFAMVSEADPELLAAVRSKMDSKLTFVVTKERNFIDEAEKDALLAQMLEQASVNMIAYLENPNFPMQLFKKKYVELREACVVERNYDRLSQKPADDDEPADFSACFKD